jgi:hypothetical protein
VDYVSHRYLTEHHILITCSQRGYYQLDHGVTASQNAIYYFQGQLAQAKASSTRKGPVAGKEYTYRDRFGIAEHNYSA